MSKPEEKDAIKVLLEKTELNQDALYTAGKETGMKGEFFKLCYRILLNRDKGPRLAELIEMIGTEKTKEIMKKYI